MEPKNIITLVQNLSEKLKKRRGLIDPRDFSANYQTAVDIQQQIAIHAKSKVFPDALMKAKAPNETMQELQYRKDIYEPITKPYWDRALGTLNRIWAEQNYSIAWGSPEVKSYFTRQFPIYKNILTYFKTIVTHYKINDPNAVLLVDVGEIPVMADEDGTGIKIDQSKELSPLVKIIPSDKVLYFCLDEYVFFKGDDTSPVTVRGDKQENTGLVFYLLDTNTLWRIYQTGSKSDYTFKIAEVYEHALGYLPAQRLGGKQLSESEGDDIIYESYFMAAIPNLNKALKLDSTLDISINKHAYPVKVYYEDDCSNPNCKGGKVAVYDPANVDAMQDLSTPAMLKDCPICNGTGRSIGFSPFRDYIHTPQKGFNSEQPITFPGFQYVSPNPEILAFNRDKIEADITKAFTFLNIDVSLKGNTGTGGQAGTSKTATQSKIDREELFSFLLILSEELFGSLQFAINAILQLRYPTKLDTLALPVVNPPMTFEIRSLDELTAEIQGAQTSNAPDAVIRELLKEYVALRFSTAKGLDVVLQAAFYCDALITKSDASIALLRAQNLISPIDAVLHIHIFYFLEQKLAEDENYILKKLPDIKNDMVVMAGEKLKELGVVS